MPEGFGGFLRLSGLGSFGFGAGVIPAAFSACSMAGLRPLPLNDIDYPRDHVLWLGANRSLGFEYLDSLVPFSLELFDFT